VGKSVIARTLSHYVVARVVVTVVVALVCTTFFSAFAFFLSLPNLHEVVQRARPSFNPRGTCPRWADSPAAPSETELYTRQFRTHGRGEKLEKEKESVRARSPDVGVVALPWAMTRRGCRVVTFQVLPTSMRSCKGHALLIIQEGRARAGQEVQPRRVGPCAAPNSSKAHGKRKE
jgi:hypothetical protein